jgi:hypothetical protein
MADSSVATLPSTSSFSSNLITAEIRVENIASSSVSVESSASTTATISVMPQTTSSSSQSQQQQQQQQAEAENNNMQNFDEPEAKKQKLDTSVKKKLEKLESRLGSVLCCAVCLDLPKTAMYQVSTSNSFISHIEKNVFSLSHKLLRIKLSS